MERRIIAAIDLACVRGKNAQTTGSQGHYQSQEGRRENGLYVASFDKTWKRLFKRLRANGASVWRCVYYSILTSLPQPIVAVPAFLLVSIFQPLLPASLGFAGGAMIFLVVQELLPESFAHSSPTEAAWGVLIGLVGMLGFIAAIGLK